MYNINNEIESTQTQLQKVIINNDRTGNAKIMVSVLGFALFIYNRNHDTTVGWFIFMALVLLLLFLFLIHEKYHEQKEYLETRCQILKKYNLRSIGKWKEFEDTGEEYLKENSYLEKDLDIFGRKVIVSIFMCGKYSSRKKKTF